MKKLLRLALIALALALFVSGCAPAARSPQPFAFTTPTRPGLPGGMFPAPQAQAAQPTLPPLPTLVPTITLPGSGAQPTLAVAQLTLAVAQPTLAPITPTAPPRLDPACLVGTWQVVNLPQAVSGSLSNAGPALALEQVEGQARYIFGADGSMTLTYQRLTAVLTGAVENRAVRAVQTLDGTATARYQADAAAGTIEMSGFGGEGIHSALEINGQTLAEGSLPAWLAFTRGQPQQDPAAVQSARASAACDGDTLILQALDPLPGPRLELSRVEN